MVLDLYMGPPFNHGIWTVVSTLALPLSPRRWSYERLIRKLLLYPNRPAVALMQGFTPWHHQMGDKAAGIDPNLEVMN